MKKDKKKREEENKEEKENQKQEKKEKVCEIFKVEKNGGETIKACGTEETKIANKGQIKSENKILRNVLIWFGILLLVFLLVFLSIRSANSFEYKGMKWDTIKEGQITVFNTLIPMIYEGEKVNHNIRLRNDPRKLDKIPFDGELNLLEMMVINNSDGFVCEGKGNNAMINFQQILGYQFGIELMKDPNASCDAQGRYIFIQIQEGDVTGIEQTGPACYNLNVNNCEIREVMERFALEALTKYN